MSNCVEISNLFFSYDKHSIYKDLTLTIQEKGITYIMGNNGCGKTTLLKLISGSLEPSSGVVVVMGQNIRELSSRETSRLIAYVPQAIRQNVDFFVKDYLSLGRTPYLRFGESPSKKDFEIVEEYAKKMGVEQYLDIKFSELSGGQKQMIAITRALIQETPIIVMDEPMSSLDIGKQAILMDIIYKLKEEGKTIILSSHNPNHTLQYPCNVCLIHERQILGNGINSFVLTEENLRAVYGDKIALDKGTNNVIFKM